jgi:chromosome segregation ATPase
MPTLDELGQAITWLAEQRKQDRDTLDQIRQQVDRFGLLIKDVMPQMERLDGEARQSAAVRGRIGRLEEQARLSQEQIAELVEQIQQQGQGQDRLVQHQQTELDREHKSLAEAMLQVTELFRREESIRNQITSLVDENKRQANGLATLGVRTDHTEHDLSSFGQRILAYEDFRKRTEPEIQAFQRNLDAMEADYNRIQQWQQATDLRWSRDLASWQEKMDGWERSLEDQTKSLQQASRDVALLRANVEQVESQVAEQVEEIQNALVDVRRLESSVEIERQEIARQATNIDGVRRRIDDQSGQIRQLDDRGAHTIGDLRELAGRVDDSRKRIEEQSLRMVPIEQRQRENADVFASLAGQITALRFEIEGALRRLDEAIQQQAQLQQDQVLQRQRIIERQLRRQVSELEQQLREAKELIPRSAADPGE